MKMSEMYPNASQKDLVAHFVSLVEGGEVGLAKLCHFHANRVLKWSASKLDLWDLIGSKAVRSQIIEDCSSVLLVRVLEGVGTYDESEGKPSTFVGAFWRTVANHLRDVTYPSLADTSVDSHSDRGGASRQQGTDRLMHDHAGAYQMPNTGLESEEEYQSILSRIEPEHRSIMLEYAAAVHGEKSSVAKRHGLTGPELSNLVNKYRTKFAK